MNPLVKDCCEEAGATLLVGHLATTQDQQFSHQGSAEESAWELSSETKWLRHLLEILRQCLSRFGVEVLGLGLCVLK